MNEIFDLSGKIVVVTGGAGHLGSAICEGLAQQGATLAIASRGVDKCQMLAERLTFEYGVQAQGFSVDIMDSASVKDLFQKVNNIWGRISVLVNNACVSTPGFFEDFSDEQWKRGIDGSINSAYCCIREVLPYMTVNAYGKIINMTSMYGVVPPNPDVYDGNIKLNNPANYGAGKAAIIQMTKYVAAYYGKQGILANAISPGPFPSFPVQRENPQFIERLAGKTMLGRIGQPKELQGAVVFLASDASNYMTGQNVCIDGGWTTW